MEQQNSQSKGLTDWRWQAVQTKNREFDGAFYFGVQTTGIFCRPSCSSRSPKRENVSFFANPSAAEQAGYGEIFFPIQTVFFLNEPEGDYTGGEFVLLQQTPRAQLKAIVLKPRKGDMLIFTTNFRPVKGSKGYYQANMKHGVSEVPDSNRHTLGIIFHDAHS